VQSQSYDAIVVGSGISGGWAAKELTEKGLRVLLLERGKNIEHIKDYVNATKAAVGYPHRGQAHKGDGGGYPVLKRDYALNADEPGLVGRADRSALSGGSSGSIGIRAATTSAALVDVWVRQSYR